MYFNILWAAARLGAPVMRDIAWTARSRGLRTRKTHLRSRRWPRDEKAKKTFYQIAIHRSDIMFSDWQGRAPPDSTDRWATGSRIGFSLAVANEGQEDGSPLKQTEWSGYYPHAIVYGKEARKLGTVLLDSGRGNGAEASCQQSLKFLKSHRSGWGTVFFGALFGALIPAGVACYWAMLKGRRFEGASGQQYMPVDAGGLDLPLRDAM